MSSSRDRDLQSIASMEAGEKGKSVEKVFAAIDRELDRQANGEG